MSGEKISKEVLEKAPDAVQEAIGVDTSGMAEAQQKFENAVDARDMAAKEKDKKNTNVAVAMFIRQNSNANG